jgi:hypothetical protein
MFLDFEFDGCWFTALTVCFLKIQLSAAILTSHFSYQQRNYLSLYPAIFKHVMKRKTKSSDLLSEKP